LPEARFDGADAVAGDAGEQGSESGSRLNRISAAHRSIIEPIDDHHAGRLGIALDGPALSCFAGLSIPALAADEVRI
jgi:hypothetical protein